MALLTNGYEPTAARDYVPFATDRDVPAAAVQQATATPADSPLQLSLIRDVAGLEALAADWTALFERSARPHHYFQSYAWNWHWAQTYLGADQRSGARCPIAILAGRRNGQLVTLWPMVLQRHAGLRELAWMGEPVSQYGDVLIDSALADHETVLRNGWAFLCRTLRPDVARLRKVRDDATVRPLLATLAAVKSSQLEAPFIDLTQYADYAAYESRFSSRLRKNRQRQMRRLQEVGPVTFKHLDQGAEASRFAGIGIEIKRRWLIDRGHVSPALADVRMSRFMTAVAADNCHPTGTRVGVLLAGEAPAAIQIGFVTGRTQILHVIAYDQPFEKMAAGVHHLEEAVRRAMKEGLTRIDLLAPKAEYKVEWADGAVGVVDYALGLSVRGRLYARVYLGFVRTRLKAAIERLPQRVRQTLVISHLRLAARRMMSLIGLG
jgi:CelD/BcsL family acetyltransferase involved in cellulose biosynthesis